MYAYRLKFVSCSLQLCASVGRFGLYVTYTTIYLVVYKIGQGLLCMGGIIQNVFVILSFMNKRHTFIILTLGR